MKRDRITWKRENKIDVTGKDRNKETAKKLWFSLTGSKHHH